MRSKTQHVTVKNSDYLLLYRKVWELLTNLYVQRCHVMSQKNERLERWTNYFSFQYWQLSLYGTDRKKKKRWTNHFCFQYRTYRMLRMYSQHKINKSLSETTRLSRVTVNILSKWSNHSWLTHH